MNRVNVAIVCVWKLALLSHFHGPFINISPRLSAAVWVDVSEGVGLCLCTCSVCVDVCLGAPEYLKR